MERILVIKLSSFGDLFHALPTVHMLKQATGAQIDWVVQPAYAGLVKCFPDVSRVIPFPRRGFLAGAPDFLRALRRERYDLVADLQGLLKSALPARLARRARGAKIIGPSFSREGARLLYHEVTGPRNKNRHAVDEVLDLIRHLGLPETEPVFPIRIPHDVPPGHRPRLAVVPSSRWATKNWPPAAFATFLKEWLKQAGGTAYLLGGHGETAACEAIVRELGERPDVRNFAGKTTLVELGGLLQEMDLVLTVDSGPMHMAAALQVPVLALFGPTDPARTGPFGPGHRALVVDRLPCRPCFSDTCARGDLACLQNLFPSQVLEAALSMLQSIPSR